MLYEHSELDWTEQAYLFEGYPPELTKKMEGWHTNADELGISKKRVKEYDRFEAWVAG